MRVFKVLMVVALLVLPAAPASAADLDTQATVARVLELTNIERQKVGVAPLSLSAELNTAAQEYSVVLASGSCFAHTCGPVPDMADRLGQAGYTEWTAIAENIAAGYPTPEAVVQGWMSSAGHRENLLSPAYHEIGIGVAVGGGRYGVFWTQDFGTRRFIPAPPAIEEAPPPVIEEAPPVEEEMLPMFEDEPPAEEPVE
jgi:uncharacterized protein YkwD